ncbi:MAG: acylneuraminate cytidylyltransferase family protein [Clostridia bacterium]|nr:acylneuraminate cytidylyltransferase family protein [Clostridia bacterium]
MKVVAFIPIKLNNERTPGKNIKAFDDGMPLMHSIQKALRASNEIDDIYVYCSKEEVKDYILDGVKFLKRDEKFDTATADVNEMFQCFAQTVAADIYILAHATAPFQKTESIERGIRAVKTGEYDSAVAVKKMQDFFWQNGSPLNYNPDKIPRTQDLKPIYVETTGLYIFTRDVIMNYKRRIGNHPYMLEMDEIESTDINNPIDFEIANALYMQIVSKLR